ncbi:hypothetical protein Clacol_001893 [Clathrus columnatus]|uniref:Translation initiation factor eIF2B subunit delta n=1 Tax=Clathrus columnatus TaxID=1419009 RepID=A0AAV5A3A3_9AGAM|nr:hypothetical protein Clacol_001893 [Clathrus columnatus]
MAAANEASAKPTKKDAPPNIPPPKPVLTKAERRAKQEKDREAKAAAKGNAATNSKPGAAGTKSTSKTSNSNTAVAGPSQISKSTKTPEVTEAAPVKDAVLAAVQSQSVPELRDETRGLRIFSHFGLPKQSGSSNLKGPLHPAIFRLALQFSDFQIVGANARCIATLNAFKTVIRDYVTPPNTTLSRHLMTYLNPQIGHLVNARPLAVSMGNAIRYLKVEISILDIDLPEQDAKDSLCERIDNYIRDHIMVADKVIQDVAGEKIKNGDVILTYAHSSVVQKVLLQAHERGKIFSVIIADSRPLLEGQESLTSFRVLFYLLFIIIYLGKQLLSVLAEAGIQCTYLLLPAVGSIIEEVTIVMFGAHSVQMDGAVYSRAGTALVAMMAKAHSVPVLVCCETHKFSEAVHLDSFNKNELAPTASKHSLDGPDKLRSSDDPNLQILNPLYDLTPPSNITAIVTEVGTIPPTSVSSVPLALGR